MTALDPLRLVVGAAFLAVAAVLDLRTRKVRDPVWIVLGSIGLAMFAADLWSTRTPTVVSLVLVPTAVLFYGVYIGDPFRTEEGRWRFPLPTASAYGIALVAAIYPIVALRDAGDAAGLRVYVVYLTSPAMMVVILAMYEAHLLKGGADAKAMMAIAVLVPTYPQLPAPLPLIALEPRLQDAVAVFFPFPLLVLLNASLLFLVTPFVFLARNAARGRLEFPQALLGYKVPLDRVPRYAWFMDTIEHGEHVVVWFPRRGQDRKAIRAALREAGFTEAWVTPGLPFIVPLAVGFVVSFVVGNPLMGLLQALT